jgi:NADH pyrophosphatase NudC (nudix superfamily)
VIRLTDDELRKPENADYYMAAKRTAALQFVRANFAGRVIHSSPEAWKKKLTEMWSGASTLSQTVQTAPKTAKPKFCGQCGAELTPGVKFCGTCGMRI